MWQNDDPLGVVIYTRAANANRGGVAVMEMQERMKQMMGTMFDNMGPEDMQSMMGSMMPEMMEHCHAKMDSAQLQTMMHDMMPKMMDGCFARMSTEEREGMLKMCREMLDQMEEKYATKSV